MHSESARLDALRRLEILDTPPEPVFDRVTQMAATLFSVPMACITLVDKDRFFFKSMHGSDIRQMPREPGFCHNTITQPGVTVIADTLVDPIARRHSLVCAAPHVRFYAGAPVRTQDGHALGTLCVLDDTPRSFTEQDEQLLAELAGFVMFQLDSRKRRADEEVNSEKARRANKLESLGMLTGGIAHDFNNFLMGIVGNASLALEQVGDDAIAKETIGNIIEAAERASDLTGQLLAYAGQRTPKKEPVNLGAMVDGVARLVSHALRRDMDLQIIRPAEDLIVMADPTQLQQVIVNLTINASESYAEKSGSITLEVSRSQDDEKALLTIRDSGCGMSPETQMALFDPFFSTKFPGRGLGMAIVHRIIELHAGAIEVDSVVGEGTTMRIALPLLAQPAPARQVVSPLRAIQPGAGHLLIIDDQRDVRHFVERAALALGYTVDVANDGEAALNDLAQRTRPDIILIDASMPVMSGEETLRRIHARHPKLAAIVMSGHDLPEVTKRFADLEVKAFLQKPFRLDELSAALKKVGRA
ncbi:MAG: response regulator [Gammaproteobacteria bacterium]|nr:response regulator [Gammaproteobacteria bacterium]